MVAEDVEDDGGATLAVDVDELLDVPLEAGALEEAVEPADDAGVLLPLGGSTDTPPLLFDEVEAVELPDVLEPVPEEALDVPLDPTVLAFAGAADELPAGALEDGDEEEEDVEGDVAAGAELCVLALCAGGALVRVLCPTGKNEPPVMRVAMMPAITATRAIPINKSGQLRLIQSMVPF